MPYLNDQGEIVDDNYAPPSLNRDPNAGPIGLYHNTGGGNEIANKNNKNNGLTSTGAIQNTVKPAVTGPGTDTGGGGGLDPNAYTDFLDFWDAWSGLDIGAAAAAWTAKHPNDPATAIGHSGDAVSYRGQDWDGITNVGSSNQAKVRLFNPSKGGGGNNPTGANNYGLSQFAGTFKDPTTPVAPFEAGKFTAPTGVSDANDPGFTTRLQTAQQALERSASARGTLLSGATLKALTRYSQNYASNEYDKVFGRDLATFNTNEGERFKAYASNAALSGDQYSRALSTFNTNTGLYNDAYSRARSNQNDLFGQQYSLASLGLAGTNANQSGNNLLTSNYINALLGGVGNGNNYFAGGANANASGQVGAANAYNAGITSGVNNYLNWYLNSRTNPSAMTDPIG